MPYENLQHKTLCMLKENKANVQIYLINGIKLCGIISGFDDDVILIKKEESMMIYKNNIASILITD